MRDNYNQPRPPSGVGIGGNRIIAYESIQPDDRCRAWITGCSQTKLK
jgi:hypothetical protein